MKITRIASRGADRDPRRSGKKEKEKRIEKKEKRRKRENRCVTHLAISGTVDEGAVCMYARRRTERIRSSVFRSRSDRPNRAIVARVYSRFLDTGERRRHGRDRTRGACVYTIRHARRCILDATRERDPRRVKHAAGWPPTLRALLHFRRRRALHRDAVRALHPRACLAAVRERERHSLALSCVTQSASAGTSIFTVECGYITMTFVTRSEFVSSWF